MQTPAAKVELHTFQNDGVPPQQGNEYVSMAGCTAVSALIVDKILYVANAGDSRAVLCRNGQAIAMSNDHKPECQEELDRILAAGGTVIEGRVNGNLNLCRSLGDFEYKSDASLTPE